MKVKPQRVEKYLNPVLQLFLAAQQLFRVLIAGRGFSKSFGNGLDVANKVEMLPRSKGLFLGVTYTQILTNTLLPMKAAWEQYCGYIDGVHYVIGRKPPEWFEKPYQKPERYENVITFWNGTTLVFGSFDRPQLIRGASYDWVIVDEALLINKMMYDQIVIPTIRPTHPIFKGKPFHRQQSFTSSMPYGTMGSWLLDVEGKAKNDKANYFYIEGTSWHNRYILGDETILSWFRDMPRLQYLVEVMNKRIRSFGALFYPALSEKHWYTDSYQYEYIDTLGLNVKDYKTDSRWDKDCDPKLPINISHDWGAFNCITIDQERPDEIRFIKAMHVAHPQTIDDLADAFCKYYAHHTKKVVYQWGDKSGNNKQANAKLTYFEQFAERLRGKGWIVIRKTTGDIQHMARHQFIINLHKEGDPRLPRIRYNANNCKDMRIALESAPMKDDKKDKTSENNPSVKPEHATHYTDAHDYRLYHGLKNRERKAAFGAQTTSLDR
jgi:hypothetical protein